MSTQQVVLPDNSQPIASASAWTIRKPPRLLRNVGLIVIPLFIIGAVTKLNILAIIAVLYAIAAIIAGVLGITVLRRRYIVALSSDALYLIEPESTNRYLLSDITGVHETKAKIGSDIITLSFAVQDDIRFYWSSTQDTEAIMSALRSNRKSA